MQHFVYVKTPGPARSGATATENTGREHQRSAAALRSVGYWLLTVPWLIPAHDQSWRERNSPKSAQTVQLTRTA